jgi:rhamnogalacturonan endolyase
MMKASNSLRRSHQGKRLDFERLEPRLLLSGRQMEYLNRGVVAVSEGSATVYVGWRLLGTDPSSIAFNLYRSTGGAAALKLNSSPLTQTTDYVDTSVNLALSNAYYVRPIIGGVEQSPSEIYVLAAGAPVQQYLSIPLNIPAPVVTADGVTHTYSANDASVGDLDGDGQYEIVLKWDPDPQDTWQQTGNVYVDAYELDGTQLWRIDLGLNIRAGAAYTNFTVYDLDGDGKAEVVTRTADGTITGTGQIIGNPTARWWRDDGRITSGPEYFTVFEGATGRALVTANYSPPRAVNPADGSTEWGDNYGHRSDTFGQCIAYLDGQRPSLVMTRGIYYPQSSYPYAKTFIVAWNWRDGNLTQVWSFEGAYNQDGNINVAYVGQGNHNLSVADVDSDGKDEIIYGACSIDDNGTGLYSTGLGHGDALHVGDFDPSRAGLEVFDIHESYPLDAGAEFRDAATGALIWGMPNTADVGRGVADDIYAGNPGAEIWATNTAGLRSVTGAYVGRTPSSMNFLVWWDADHVRELLDDTHIDKYGLTADTRLLTASGCSSNNSTKATPCLSADILGDWREEVIWRTADSRYLRIYTTTIPATDRIYTLMHDTQYREAIAWQNVAYNQPPHTSFFLGDGMSAAPTPNIYLVQSVQNPPPVPANVTATVITPTRIDVTWSASTGATMYRVKRATSAGGPYTTIGFVSSGTTFSDTHVEVSGVYYYLISARNNSGESADSALCIGSVTGLPAPTNLHATVVSETELDLTWAASAGATSYLVRRSYYTGGPYTVIASGVTSTSYADNTVTSGPTYYYVVAAVSSTNGSANSNEAAAAISLPSPWVSQGIGSVTTPGYASYSSGTYSVTGAVGGFQFVSQGLVGDCTIITKLESLSTTTGWGGIMIRNSMASNSRYVNLYASNDSKDHIFFYYQTNDGGSTRYRYDYCATPIWLKLTRVGDTFTGYWGTDGSTWNLLSYGGTSQVTISMNTLVYGGMAVSSYSAGSLDTAVFSNVSITSANVAPTVAAAASSSPATLTGPGTTNISVLGADDGGEPNLTYTWSVTGTPSAPVTFLANGTNPAKATTATFTRAGTYNLQVKITDTGGLYVVSPLTVTVYSTIAGRMVFYNDSKFDAHTGYLSGDPAANLYDDNAIATDKSALLPGQTATFSNYTSYALGLNGIMIDIRNLAAMPTINNYSQFFTFKVGNDNSVSNWTAAPDPILLQVRQGAGTNSSDRVTIVWDDQAIENQWLQVTVLANASTGLASADVFYFGNLVGESGNDATVTVQDEDATLSHRSGFTRAPITNNYDYNRDRQVNAADALIARANHAGQQATLQLIAAPVGSAPASEGTLQPLTSSQGDATASAALVSAAALVSQAQPDDSATLEIDAVASAAESATVLAFAVPVQMASAPPSPSGNAAPLLGAIAPQINLVHSSLIGAALSYQASNRPAQTPKRESQASFMYKESRTNPPAIEMPVHRGESGQDRLRDVFFAKSTRGSLIKAENVSSDDASAAWDIDGFLTDCWAAMTRKSSANAVDALLADTWPSSE